MTEEIWKLIDYDCQDGKCLMIWNIDKDSKLGALSLDHRSIGEAIIEELNKLENYNRDIKEYVETVEEANNQLRNIRDRLEEENNYYKKREETLLNEIEDFQELLEKEDTVCHKRILQIIDDKIAVNTAINENLEQQAQAIFKSWFVDFEPFGGVMPDDWNTSNLGSFVTIKRGGSPRPIQNYLSETGYRWLKISDVTSLNSPFILDIKEHIIESGLKKTVLLKQGALVLSNSATPGIPKILDVDSCIHDGWLYFPESKLSNEYLYLLFKFIRKDLVALGNGSVFTNLKTDILKQYEISLPSERVLNDFQTVISPLFEAMRNIARENKSLAALRDTLLPKLMNGEIDVSNVRI